MNKEERPGIQSKTKYTGQKEKGYQGRERKTKVDATCIFWMLLLSSLFLLLK